LSIVHQYSIYSYVKGVIRLPKLSKVGLGLLMAFIGSSAIYAKSVDANAVPAVHLVTGVQYPAMVTVGADVMDTSVPLILKSEGTLGFDKCTFIMDVTADRTTERVRGKLREVVCYNAEGVKFVSGNLNLQDNLVDPSLTLGLRGKLVTKQAGLLRGFGKKLDDVSYVQILAGQKAGIVVHQDVEIITQPVVVQNQIELKKVFK
jgi:hypothetical protein